jgi:hypothetical protein
MAGDRSRYGLLVAALGAVLLAVSVFLPWYGVSFTASGIAFAQQIGDQVVNHFGNASLQQYLSPLHAGLSSLVGQQFAAVSADQVFKYMNIVLLVLAGLALLDALLPLARAGSVPDGAGASLVLLGGVASVCVAFRMIVPPVPDGGLIALSLREGSWLALLGSLSVLVGGLWPRVPRAVAASESRVEGAWSGLSGWTPEGP